MSNPEQISNVANLQETLDLLQKQVHPGYASGRYYFSHCYNGSAFTAFAPNYIFYTYFYIAKKQQFNRISTITNAVGGTGSTIRIGIYNVAGGIPTTLVIDAGTISAETVAIKEIIINVTLETGWYAFACSSTSGSTTIIAVSANSMSAGFLGVSTPVAVPNAVLRSLSTQFGSFPISALETSLLNGNSPLIYLRAA
ncbi:MAG: hypothetical protein ACYTXI_24470 [Nostoc sp.]